jgi:serine protease AprX
MRRFPLLFLLALTVAAVSAPGASAKAAPPLLAVVDPSLHIEPMLQAAAQLDAKSTVRVIVQKANPLAASSDVAKSAKGKLVEDFSVIPAFTADLKLGDVMTLATNPDVRYVSLDAVVKQKSTVDTSQLTTIYPQDVSAPAVWNATGGPGATGLGVTVAVVDTGLDVTHPDFHGNVSAVNVNPLASSTKDGYGHGTHVAGIIAAHNPNGQYIGVAPDAHVIGVKIADDSGNAFESDLLRGLGWVLLNQSAQHIRVVNLSVGTTVPGSYAYSPTDAAVERLWSSGITVVVAAGNLGNNPDAVSYAPANDPYVITAGCLDDNLTANTTADDSLCPISSRGVTQDGFAKPDVIAPGRKITSTLAAGVPVLAQEYPDRITLDGKHIRLSGTSMATPVVSGTVALLLQRFPNLTPDQIKGILTSTAVAYPGEPDHAGVVNALAALNKAPNPPSTPNTGVATLPGLNFATGLGSVLFDGSRWASGSWDGSRWVTSMWDGSRWVSAGWDGSRWVAAAWDGSRWVSSTWDGSRWVSSMWDGSRWVSAAWDGSRWVSSTWDGSRWVSSTWDGSRWASSAWDGSRWASTYWYGTSSDSAYWDAAALYY